MPARRIKVLLVVGLIVLASAGGLLAWLYGRLSVTPSPLIADNDLPNKMRNGVVPTPYWILVRIERWNHDPARGRLERLFECTVLSPDNAPVDPKMVSDHLEKWIATLVNVNSATDETPGSPDVCRLVRYEGDQTAGELRYSITPVDGAALVVDGKESAGNFLALKLRITEQRKP
jgi:hypothetical protein